MASQLEVQEIFLEWKKEYEAIKDGVTKRY